jgi:ubiquinone/menaquinone biosynthesis C-methylase UbiE
MRLNLGCGRDTREGWVNVDLCEAEVCLDLDTHPWPWDDASIERIYASHVIEHLHDFRGFMAECYRVLEPGGVLEILTPHPLCEWFHQDPTHVRGYTANTFVYYLTPANPCGDYGYPAFRHVATTDRSFRVNGVDAREVSAVLTK